MTDSPADQSPTLVKLVPSQDWLVTFWCSHCDTYHQLLLLKQRKNFKAFLIENHGTNTKSRFFADYKSFGGAPDDKVFDDIEDQHGPEYAEDEDNEVDDVG